MLTVIEMRQAQLLKRANNEGTSSLIAELLRAEGTRAERYTFGNPLSVGSSTRTSVFSVHVNQCEMSLCNNVILFLI